MKKLLILSALGCFLTTFAQQKQVKRATIGFLNVENLWDTVQSADYIDGTKDINNPAFHRSVPLDSLKFLETTEDYKGEWNSENLIGKKVIRKNVLAEEFTVDGPKNWNSKKYNHKLENISKLISQIGRSYTNDSPVICGLLEVENRQVIQDLINTPALAKSNYGIVHYNSYDARAVDTGLIYQKNRFKLEKSYTKEVKLFKEDNTRRYTRDVTVVIGKLDGEQVAIFLNHWPSRSGGEAISQPSRNAAATVLKNEMDKVGQDYPGIKMFAMGDFNDDPNSPSLKKYLKAVGDPKDLSEQAPYYNPMVKLFKNGVASLAYRDAPNLFDQIIFSKSAYSTEKLTPTYSVITTEIFAPSYLITPSGQYKGYPFRSWNGNNYTGGYSDHFPAFTVLQREHTK